MRQGDFFVRITKLNIIFFFLIEKNINYFGDFIKKVYLCNHFRRIIALVAELADALDLGSSVARREGSSPFRRTKEFIV